MLDFDEDKFGLRQRQPNWLNGEWRKYLFDFRPYPWGKDPIWRAYSDGLKPSTRESVVVPVFSGFLWQVGLFFVRPPTSIHMSRTANLHPECRPETWKEEKHPIWGSMGIFQGDPYKNTSCKLIGFVNVWGFIDPTWSNVIFFHRDQPPTHISIVIDLTHMQETQQHFAILMVQHFIAECNISPFVAKCTGFPTEQHWPPQNCHFLCSSRGSKKMYSFRYISTYVCVCRMHILNFLTLHS